MLSDKYGATKKFFFALIIGVILGFIIYGILTLVSANHISSLELPGLKVSGGASFQGNNLYIKNPSSPTGKKTWGIVISTADGTFNLGPATDAIPVGGVLATYPFKILSRAPSNSLVISSGGDVSVGGDLSVNGNINNVREVWGAVLTSNVNGNMISNIDNPGSGDWTLTRLGQGEYNINFNSPFSTAPVVVASGKEVSDKIVAVPKVIGTSKVQVNVYGLDGNKKDGNFHFIIKGKV